MPKRKGEKWIDRGSTRTSPKKKKATKVAPNKKAAIDAGDDDFANIGAAAAMAAAGPSTEEVKSHGEAAPAAVVEEEEEATVPVDGAGDEKTYGGRSANEKAPPPPAPSIAIAKGEAKGVRKKRVVVRELSDTSGDDVTKEYAGQGVRSATDEESSTEEPDTDEREFINDDPNELDAEAAAAAREVKRLHKRHAKMTEKRAARRKLKSNSEVMPIELPRVNRNGVLQQPHRTEDDELRRELSELADTEPTAMSGAKKLKRTGDAKAAPPPKRIRPLISDDDETESKAVATASGTSKKKSAVTVADKYPSLFNEGAPAAAPTAATPAKAAAVAAAAASVEPLFFATDTFLMKTARGMVCMLPWEKILEHSAGINDKHLRAAKKWRSALRGEDDDDSTPSLPPAPSSSPPAAKAAPVSNGTAAAPAEAPAPKATAKAVARIAAQTDAEATLVIAAAGAAKKEKLATAATLRASADTKKKKADEAITEKKRVEEAAVAVTATAAAETKKRSDADKTTAEAKQRTEEEAIAAAEAKKRTEEEEEAAKKKKAADEAAAKKKQVDEEIAKKKAEAVARAEKKRADDESKKKAEEAAVLKKHEEEQVARLKEIQDAAEAKAAAVESKKREQADREASERTARQLSLTAGLQGSSKRALELVQTYRDTCAIADRNWGAAGANWAKEHTSETTDDLLELATRFRQFDSWHKLYMQGEVDGKTVTVINRSVEMKLCAFNLLLLLSKEAREAIKENRPADGFVAAAQLFELEWANGLGSLLDTWTSSLNPAKLEQRIVTVWPADAAKYTGMDTPFPGADKMVSMCVLCIQSLRPKIEAIIHSMF